MDRVDVINTALDMIDEPTTYVEIGVRFGGTFRAVQADTKVGVDPMLRSRRQRMRAGISDLRWSCRLRSGEFMFSMTSDKFFDTRGKILAVARPNVVLIDGLHTAEQSYRDATNALRWLHPRGVVVMHDCNPVTEARGAATLSEAVRHPDFDGRWNGEPWRTIVRLRACDRTSGSACSTATRGSVSLPMAHQSRTRASIRATSAPCRMPTSAQTESAS